MGLIIHQDIDPVKVDPVEVDFDDFLQNHDPTELLEEIFSHIKQYSNEKRIVKKWLEHNMYRLEIEND